MLVTEAVLQDDWVSPEWSSALLAGAVPIYVGAPNIAEFAPHPDSYIDLRSFSSAAELWELIQVSRSSYVYL